MCDERRCDLVSKIGGNVGVAVVSYLVGVNQIEGVVSSARLIVTSEQRVELTRGEQVVREAVGEVKGRSSGDVTTGTRERRPDLRRHHFTQTIQARGMAARQRFRVTETGRVTQRAAEELFGDLLGLVHASVVDGVFGSLVRHSCRRAS